MKDAMAKVREFHEKFGAPCLNKPAIPHFDRQSLRIELIKEEFDEFRAAWCEDDLEQIADALADMVYVICGAALEYGIPLAEVFDEVHASNMRKVGGGQRADGKITKPEGWIGPDIKAILERASQ